MKIIVAIDKFKGSVSQQQANAAAHRAIMSVLPKAQVVTIPACDGGDGTATILAAIMGGERVNCTVSAVHSGLPPVSTNYWVANDTALIDIASAAGLALVPPSQRDVMHSSTLGTGQMIVHALQQGYRHIVIGLGGSATCDCGAGLLSALGFRFVDNNGNTLDPIPINLTQVARIDDSQVTQAVRDTRFTVITDVNNPLCGEHGAAAVFAPQKGASPQQVEQLETALRHMAQLFPPQASETAGAGAAGGVGAAMMALLDAKPTSGAHYVLQAAQFEHHLAHAHLVITGEGRIDEQSGMGKITGEVARIAHHHGVKCVAVCGTVSNEHNLPFTAILPVSPPFLPLDEAMRPEIAVANIELAVAHLITTFFDNEDLC